jgi:hypothetical protein
MAALINVLHVLSSFWFVTGLVARNIALGRAARSADIAATDELLGLSGIFEKRMVIPGSQAVLLFGVVLVFVRDYRFAGPGYNWILVSLLLLASVIVLIPTVFVPKGKRFERVLAEATGQGSVTPELTAAFRDRAVRWAHRWEIAVVIAIIVLMVTKPF